MNVRMSAARAVRRAYAFALMATFLLVGHSVMAGDFKPGPQGEPSLEKTGRYKQQEYRIPFKANGGGPMLQALLIFPNAQPPYPLAIINHGSPRHAGDRAKRALFPESSRWFAARGFAALILTRRGYGDSEGNWVENYGPCANPNYLDSGNAAADDVEAAIRFMRKQSFIDPKRILLAGVSAGGWAVVAASSRNPEGVLAVLNFAGGRGSLKDDEVCEPGKLFRAAGEWGKTARVPILWIYSENDKFFGPKIARAMFDAYKGGGANAEFLAMPPFDKDGHRLFGFGAKAWSEPVEAYLKKIPGLLGAATAQR